MSKPKKKAKPPADPNAALAQILAGLGQGPAVTDDPPVYWAPGKETHVDTSSLQGIKRASDPKNAYKDETKTSTEATGEFYRWTDQQRKEWGQTLVANGLIEPEDAGDYQTLLKAWTTSVGEAANFYSQGRKVTPQDVVKIMGATAGAGSKSKTTTTTSKSINLTDPTSAKALVNQVLSQQLGREANADEVRAFTQVLNTAETNAPSVTTQTTTTNADGGGTQTSKTTGGLDGAGKAQLLTDQARKKPEYGAYQAATTYMNALYSAIAAPA